MFVIFSGAAKGERGGGGGGGFPVQYFSEPSCGFVQIRHEFFNSYSVHPVKM